MNASCPDDAGTVAEDLEIILSLVYGTISIFLYFYLIYIIYNNKNFHHPFFYQFILLSIANICLWLSMLVINRIITHPLVCNFFWPAYSKPTALLKILILGYYGSLAVQFFTVSTISINRMTVVLYPLSTPKFWSRFNAYTIEAILLASFFYSFYLFDWGGVINLDKFSQRLMVGYSPGWPYIPFVLMAAILSVFCLLVIFITTAISLLKLCRSVMYATSSAENSLFWTNVGFSVTTAIISFYSIAVYVLYYMEVNVDLAVIIVNIRGFFFDVNCLLPPWLLLATNRQIRNRILPGRNKTTSFQVTAFSQQRWSRSK